MPEERPAKPVIDAVNDAVGALTEVVRALRSSAKAAKRDAKGRAHAAKSEIKRGAADLKRGAVEAESDLRQTIRRAWDTVRHPAHESPSRNGHAASSSSTRKTARKTKRS